MGKEDPPRQYRKPPASDVGLKAERGCTDVFFIILFLIFWGVMFYAAAVIFKLGDPNRLIYGVDYMGNVCGHGEPTGIDANSAAEWGDLKLLWYPVTYDFKSNTLMLTDARKFGVCVRECPQRGLPGGIKPYGPPVTGDNWPVRFDSTAVFNRCVPDFLGFDCLTGLPPTDQEKCNKLVLTANKTFGNVDDTLDKGFEALKTNWWIILSCVGIAIVLCFFWLFILRRLVKPVVVVTAVLAFVLLAVLGLMFYLHSNKLKDRNEDQESKYFIAAASITWIVAFIYLCVMIFLWKDIMVACDIIEEASKIPIQMPTMMLVPPVLMLFIIPFVVFGVIVAVYIHTAGDKITLTLPVPEIDNNQLTNSTVDVKSVSYENWRPYAHIFNLFMFLWTLGFIHAIGFMIISFCAIFWYWSIPGDGKVPEAGVCAATKLTLGNHIGTLLFGSLIVAIIQVVRVILAMVEKRMRNTAGNNEAVKCLMCYAQCCLAYFERVVKFINKNAYIVCTMTGENFFGSARHAMSLLLANALSVGAVTIVGEYVMIVGKILITCGITAIAWAIANTQTDNDDGSFSGNTIFVMVVVAILGYFISCIFVSVFGVCIDAVLLSYCYDLEQHNGADKPYYFPSDLAKHVDKAKDRAEIKKKQKKSGALEQQLQEK